MMVDTNMLNDERLGRLITAEEAVALIDQLATEGNEPGCVEGFIMRPNGERVAMLDLILDISTNFRHLTVVERCTVLKMFISNRAAPDTMWEVW